MPDTDHSGAGTPDPKTTLILKYIAAELDTPDSGDELLFQVLHFNWFGIPPIDIARLSVEVAARQYGDKKISLRRLLHDTIHAPAKDLFAAAAHEGLRHAGSLLEQWIAAAAARGPESLLEDITREGRLLREKNSLPCPANHPKPTIERLEPAFESALLDRFTLNVTALNSYLRCPLEFYYKNMVRVPAPQNDAAAFGSSVHYALEQLFSNMPAMPGGGRQRPFPQAERFLHDFETCMHRYRSAFTSAQFAQRMAYGRQVLQQYYDARIHAFSTVVAIERMMRITWHGVPLKGKPDKLEFDGRQVNIVDYKSGTADKAMRRMQPPHEADPNGGDYWRQAVFYAILVNNYPQKNWTTVSAEFDFIEPDAAQQYRREKLRITAADIATVTQQIAGAWEKIQSRAFYTGCGKADCHWCNFVITAADLRDY